MGEESGVVSNGPFRVLADLLAGFGTDSVAFPLLWRFGGDFEAGFGLRFPCCLCFFCFAKAVEGCVDVLVGHGKVDSCSVEQELCLERTRLVFFCYLGFVSPVAAMLVLVSLCKHQLILARPMLCHKIASGAQGVAQVFCGIAVVFLEDARQCAGAQGTSVVRPFGYDVVQGVERGALGHHAAGNLLVEEVDVFGIWVRGVALQDQLRHVLEGACALHRGHARGDFVQVVGLAQLGGGQFSHAMLALPAQLRGASTIAYAQGGRVPQEVVMVVVAAMQTAVQGGGRQSRGGAHSQIGGLIDGLAYLE